MTIWQQELMIELDKRDMLKVLSYRAFKQFYFSKCVKEPGELPIKMIRVKEIPEDSITGKRFPMLDEDYFTDVFFCLDLVLRRLGCLIYTSTTAQKPGIHRGDGIRGLSESRTHMIQAHGIHTESWQWWLNKLRVCTSMRS